MAQIDTGRILWGVQYALLSDGMECVADWFTTSEEAWKRVAMCRRLDGVYTNVRLVQLRLPDGGERAKLTKMV